MTIYRCKLEFNNADTCEWERWDEFVSEWYFNKTVAQQHMPEFERALERLKTEVYYEYPEYFKYEGLFIEEAVVHDDFVPFEIRIM